MTDQKLDDVMSQAPDAQTPRVSAVTQKLPAFATYFLDSGRFTISIAASPSSPQKSVIGALPQQLHDALIDHAIEVLEASGQSADVLRVYQVKPIGNNIQPNTND